MQKTIAYAALAAALVVAGPSLAQTKPAASKPATSTATPPASTTEAAPQTAAPDKAAPPASSPAPTGSTADTAANAGASATLMSGMSVKDNTGALIGEVKSVKDGLATIAMGSDTFTVDANKLGVSGGAATINATQAELKKMLPAKK